MLSRINKYNDIIKIGKFIYKPNNVNNELMKYKKLSIDTNDDYLLSQKISNNFNNYDFTYEDVLKYLEKNNYDDFENF
jgi:spore coat polysaccharide biosynthesis protein SpsF (cytidylyltransferase family)